MQQFGKHCLSRAYQRIHISGFKKSTNKLSDLETDYWHNTKERRLCLRNISIEKNESGHSSYTAVNCI